MCRASSIESCNFYLHFFFKFQNDMHFLEADRIFFFLNLARVLAGRRRNLRVEETRHSHIARSSHESQFSKPKPKL